MTNYDKNQVIAMWSQHFEMLNQFSKKNKYLIINNLIANIAIIFVDDFDKFFVKSKKTLITIDQLKHKVLKKFHRYIDFWNSRLANKLSSHKDWNHRIDLQSNAKSSTKKVYKLSREQIAIVKKYIDDMLRKDFIKFSTSFYATSMLIVKKLDENFRVCVNYKAFNALTIKNRNAFSLIKDILARFCATKFYSKFDIIVAFNEIRMREDDEKKIAFLTRYDLFKYVVMSFELCNAFETFQVFINATLREYLDDICTKYLNDILIYSKTRENHVKYVSKMLERLQKVELYLNIDKCEFFVTKIKYINLIIIIEKIKMNSKKIKIIVNWQIFKNLKNVQIFLDFVNFYRKFILKYFKLAKSLTQLTKLNEKDFVFSWNLDNSKKKIFKGLKLIFITISIFQHFDLDKKIWIEIDVSNYVVIVILSQMNFDEKLHSIVFMFKRMILTKCNYEIYDKKLLTIIKVFEKWRSKCVETSIENFIKIFIDHKNLKLFMSSKQLNRKQVKWAKFLSKFNFKIVYKSRTQETKSNNLTRRSKNLSKNNDDARKKHNFMRLLKNEHLKKDVRIAINLVVTLLNESRKRVVRLVVMLYDLSEKKSFAKREVNDESFANTFQRDEEREVDEKSILDSLDNQLNIMTRIRAIYLDDVVLQRIVKIKRESKRRISMNITRIELKLELIDCKIKNNLFWVKKRIYVSQNEILQEEIIKHIHESSLEDHVDKTTTYDRLSQHYYWLKMTNTMTRYLKVCHLCKRIKVYREEKHDLLKSLLILERYFQEISIDFITSLLECTRNGRVYEHVMIVVDRLFKKKKFIVLNSLKVETIVQAFIEWAWREKEYS